MENLAAFLQANPMNMATSDAEFVAPKHRSDLVAIATAEKEPMFRVLERWLYWLFGYKVCLFHSIPQGLPDPRDAHLLTPTPSMQGSEMNGENGNMTRYSDGKIRNFVRICAVVVSSLLPILSIVGLYFIKEELVRLGVIVIFCFVCSATMAVLTNAKNIEIIAATAAYVTLSEVQLQTLHEEQSADIAPDTRQYRSFSSVKRRHHSK